MTVNFKETVGFSNLSAIDFQTKSSTGEGNIRWGGTWSFTSGFNPVYSMNPYDTTAANTAVRLATLIKDLYEKKIIS